MFHQLPRHRMMSAVKIILLDRQTTTFFSGYSFQATQHTCHSRTSGYRVRQSMGFSVQPGFQPGFQSPPGYQQDVSPFFHEGQPCYRTSQPHPKEHCHQASVFSNRTNSLFLDSQIPQQKL
ncbi:hypothetical protein DPMN_108167 [Dreissena polymorpha]|uniref:Uncharacterized protein n=1 Tax=Dreissena polymorpha TaxID=45954 RepID=A0A9D4K8C3_DREPO|nr:hypothetical protein DPMN_108167 [Dreissena polymorpha]